MGLQGPPVTMGAKGVLGGEARVGEGEAAHKIGRFGQVDRQDGQPGLGDRSSRDLDSGRGLAQTRREGRSWVLHGSQHRGLARGLTAGMKEETGAKAQIKGRIK